MLVIVEGIDRVGKSTLVEKLVNECGFVQYMCEPRKYPVWFVGEQERKVSTNSPNICDLGSRGDVIANLSKMNAEVCMLEALMPYIGRPVVIDRLHFSEAVYGNADRDYSCSEAFFDFDYRLSKLGATVIYVEPTDIERSSNEHGKDLTLHEEMFEDLLRVSACEVQRLKYDQIDEVVKQWKGKLQ